MRSTLATAPTLIVTCGNADAGDDAVGSAVAAHLARLDLPDVEVFDLGTGPAMLTDLLDGRYELIVVDAVQWPGRPPGQVVDMDWRQCRAVTDRRAAPSTHGLTIADQLALADKLGLLPSRVRVIGLVIDTARVGLGMRGVAAEHIGLLISRIHGHLWADRSRTC